MIPRLLGGRYEITRLRRGGPVADTYEGFDQQQRRPVVMEVLHTGLSSDLPSVALFTNSFEAAARLVHPGIVPVSRATVVRDVHFAVRESVEGPALGEFLLQHGRPRPVRAAVIAAAVAEALGYAHEQRVVHGGICPSEILLAGDGEVKLSGFGLAATQVADAHPHYVAPEITSGAAPDPRSDLYALGCCLYEMLTDLPPFRGETPQDIRQQHAEGELVFPDDPDSDDPVASELAAITERLLAKQPDDRYQTAAELLGSLRGLLQAGEAELAPGETSAGDVGVVPPAPAVGEAAAEQPAPQQLGPEQPGFLGAGFEHPGPGPQSPVQEGADADQAALDPTLSDIAIPPIEPPRVNDGAFDPASAVYQEYEAMAYGDEEESKPAKRTVAVLATAVLIPFAVGGLMATQWTGGSGSGDGSQAETAAQMSETTTTVEAETTTTDDQASTTTSKPAAETTTTTSTTTTTTTTLPPTTQPSTSPPTTRPATTPTPTAQVPNVQGDRQWDAERKLRNAGFNVNVDRTDRCWRWQDGTVTGQRPGPGQSREVGSTVTITVCRR